MVLFNFYPAITIAIELLDVNNPGLINLKIDKVGKYKYEAYVRKNEKSRKFVFIKDEENKELFIITGTEGK